MDTERRNRYHPTKQNYIKWASLSINNPQLLATIVEGRAKKFISEGNQLTTKNLNRGFYSIIYKYYEGGFSRLLTNIGLKKENPDRTIEIPVDRRGIRWADTLKVNPELVQRYIEERVRTYIDNGIALTKPSIRTAMGNGTFAQMISIYYRGGYHALKEKFGLNHKGRLNKPHESTISPNEAYEQLERLLKAN